MSMSVGGTTGFSNSFQWRSPATTSSQAKSNFTSNDAPEDSVSTPPASSSGTLPYASFGDGIQVNLPNGLSVGVFRISGGAGGAQGATTPAPDDSAYYAQMLQSVEQLVADFANAPGAASNGAASNGTAPANSNSLHSAAKLAPGQSMDEIDVSLPNGYSAEIFHINQAGGGSASGSSDDQMVKAMEQLIANLSAYPATAASAYNKTATDASSATENVNSVA